ncbi:TlpA family protein disulfide reductase [Anatilimnocola floriformis]|uniref:TlpA family protein disulfide reductase n=1 Tax=Anatilimnocola floriformis TaxID=2948575 RepID=UPI0020C262D2|nr:TlpA family protein disulfide reductase [Anatilimnocola floriformis]
MAVRSRLAWLVLGMMLAGGLTGCGGDGQPVTAEKSKFRPAEETVGLPPTDVPRGLPTGNSGENQPADQKLIIEKSAGTTPPAVAENGGKQPPATPNEKGTPETPAAPAGGKEVTVSQEVKQMVVMIQEMVETPPPGNNENEQLTNLAKRQAMIVELSQRILAANAHPQVNDFALGSAAQALRMLGELGDPSAPMRMATFAKAVAASPNADIARKGRLMLFNGNVSAQLAAKKVDAPAILKELEKLLADDAGDQDVLMIASEVCQVLGDRGYRDEAVKGMRAIAAAYKDHKSEQLAAAGKMHEYSANLIELNVRGLLKDVLAKKPDANEKLLTGVQGLLTETSPSPAYIQAIVDIISQLEKSGHEELAKQFLGIFETGYAKHENAEITKFIARYAEMTRKRFAMVGQPFAASAVSIEGKDKPGVPLDLQAMKGKVLLVCCWRTDIESARNDLPVLRQTTEKLQPQGLEVISLVLDTQLAELQTVLQFNRSFIPWTVYVSPDVAKGEKFQDWHESSLAKELNLFGLPLYILVDKEGKVDSLHYKLDSEKLGLRLKELLGLPEVPKFEFQPPPPLSIDNPTIPKAEPTPSNAPSAGPPAPQPPTPPAPAVPAPAASEPKITEPKAAEPNKQGSLIPDLRQIDRQLAGLFSPFGLLSVLAADEPAPAAEANPYLAKPDLTANQLNDWIERMLDKPKTIQSRPGFSAAIAEACDRILADKTAKENAQLVAIENKLAILHRAACDGDEKADQQLAAFVATLKDDARPRIARQTSFFQEERKVLDASDAKPEEITSLLKELQDFYGKEKLAAKHLRMASGTVDLINKLEDGDAREKHFSEFGAVFAKSSDKELARYGKKLAKKPETKESDLVGKPLELGGNTADDKAFVWEKYRGKVVIVDFWATWCGPCRKEMPNVKAFRDQHKDQGFEIVGVSVDKDLEALAAYLQENQIPWETLAGDEAGELAEKYGVRGIPTMMLVDQKGIVVAVAHNIAALAPQAEKLLAK